MTLQSLHPSPPIPTLMACQNRRCLEGQIALTVMHSLGMALHCTALYFTALHCSALYLFVFDKALPCPVFGTLLHYIVQCIYQNPQSHHALLALHCKRATPEP